MYRVVVQGEAQATVNALPAEGLVRWFEVLDLLEVRPWAGLIFRPENPDANILTLAFGPDSEGLITYMVLDRDLEVYVLEVQWLG
ncbi:MAG: hypothetical protein ACT4NY_22695 [Pseudonocardiales bacterium]